MVDNKTKTPPIYNFGAGPACLPTPVLEEIRADIPEWFDGMSIMEASHRLPEFMTLTQQIEANLRTLLNIPEEFALLFMHGGARTQFSAIPMNLLAKKTAADYVVTGHWSNLAFQDAKQYCNAHLTATSADDHFTNIPDTSKWSFSPDGAYLHYTDNETIQGIEFPKPPQSGGKPLVSDMTSNILTRAIDFKSFGLIYASAQKNLGIAGITMVIVRKDLLGNAHPFTPPTLNYGISSETQSMCNTPPVFNWYVLGLVAKWSLSVGGLPALTALCEQKAKILYDVIDSSGFYRNPVEPTYRSRLNIPFTLPSAELDAKFIKEAASAGLKQLKGHKVAGGCRASLYNAMPLAGVVALADFMRDFEKRNG